LKKRKKAGKFLLHPKSSARLGGGEAIEELRGVEFGAKRRARFPGRVGSSLGRGLVRKKGRKG